MLTWQHSSTRARHRVPPGTACREAPVGAFEAKVARGGDPRADLSVRGKPRREALFLGDSTWPAQLRRACGSTPTRDLRVTCRPSDQTQRVTAWFALGEPQGTGRHRFPTPGFGACAAAERRGPTPTVRERRDFDSSKATNRPPGRAAAAHPPRSLPGFDARYATDAVATPWPCRARRIPVWTLVDVKKSVETKPNPPPEHLLREQPSGRTVWSLPHRVSIRNPHDGSFWTGVVLLTE